MKRAYLRQHGKDAFELIEEAFHLLRSIPASTLALYYFGTVPFVAGFLVFWTDMSNSLLAARHLGGATLGLTALFLWMKFFQARFARSLLGRLSGSSEPEWSFRLCARSFFLQAVIQSSALFALPIALLVLLPLGWVYAFYQNATVLDDGCRNLKPLVRSASQQSTLWPRQNHILLLVLSGFAFYVFLNWLTFGLFAPQLLKMLFGIESQFTQSPLSLLNTTFFAAMAGLTFLSVDPLIKACYVLRCFQGLSLHSGEDLRTDLRRFSGIVQTAAVCAALLLSLAPLHAETASPQPPPAVSSPALDRSISDVMQREKYAWRMPREDRNETEKEGLIISFFKTISKMVSDAVRWIIDKIGGLFDWLFGRKGRHAPADTSFSWATPQLGLLFLILALAACLLALLVLRARRARRSAAGEASALAPIPDLESEHTRADELPEDEWTLLARRLWDRGELRLALRAFYLASLSYLASRGLITITRSKSNLDYKRELRRRAHALPDLSLVFNDNVRVFDGIWYGSHEANSEVLQRFLANIERMKAAS